MRQQNSTGLDNYECPLLTILSGTGEENVSSKAGLARLIRTPSTSHSYITDTD